MAKKYVINLRIGSSGVSFFVVQDFRQNLVCDFFNWMHSMWANCCCRSLYLLDCQLLGGVLCSSLAAFHFSIRFSVKSTISFCTLSSYAVRPHFSLTHGPSKNHQIGCESIKFSFNIHSHLELSIHSKIWKHKKIEKQFISVEFWCLKGKNKTIFRLGAIFSGFRE